jgi:putative Ca2+/H+ antiporter (TMEM165/GDT1 family)
MRRKTFDGLLASGGLIVAIMLLVAGALLTWAHSFVTDEVHNQLAAEKIYFPDKGTSALTSNAEIKKYVTKYAGQEVTTGAQAEVFADHYIAVHLREIGGGQTYSQLSEKSLANPKDSALAAQVQTVFRGETLRGLLLNAYAFGKMASIALIAAIVSFVGAVIMLILSALGLWHSRRVDRDEELGARHQRIGATTAA